MNLTHGVLSLTLAAGLAGSVAAYRAAAGEAATVLPAPVARSAPPARQVVLPGARFAWAPCKPGAHLERGTCVVEVVQTVVLPGSAPASSTGGAAASTPVRDVGDEQESDDDGGAAAETVEPEDAGDDGQESDEAEDSDDDADEADEADDHENVENGEDGEDEPDEDQSGEDG